MRIKVWGARGSIPTPIRPEDVRQKIISAILNMSETRGELREKLAATIFSDSQLTSGATWSKSAGPGNTPEKHQQERQKFVEAYLDQLSPLAGTTASGNTPCLEIQSGDDLFIIDAGSGIRELGLQLMKGDWGLGKGVIHLFFSHPHWDHIQGFPFFRPAFIPGNKIFIYSVHDIEAALRRQQEFISFPVSLDYMQATMEFIRLEPNDVLEFNDLRVRTWRNFHPGDAYSFRFEKGNKSFVYASDASYPVGTDIEPHVKFFEKTDLLIFDSQFTQRESDEKEDWGHSSSFVGIELAQAATVKELLLYHYDPTFSDKELEKILEDTLKFQENQYPSRDKIKVSIAQEGQLFNLMPTPITRLEHVPGGKVVILKPAGIFDEAVATELALALEKLKSQEAWPPQLVVDMSEVELLQVAGLRALVKLRKEQQGTPMVLAAPSINVQQLIELAGYLDFFAIYPSVHTALNALKAHETLNLPGQIIKNRYSVTNKIGEGRLGTVFKANDTRRNKAVAIKILSPSFSEGAIEQFLNQARQIIDLVHPNIVGVYDCDEDRGLSYMIEEFIEGKTLQQLIDEREGQPLPLESAIGIAEHITHGLEYAHSHGVIHGDLKPKNVLIWNDQVKISDFGLGRLESGSKSLINIDVPLAMSSVRYVAPEQILGHPIDARTDLYALGTILYEIFTGQPLFIGTDEEILQRQRSAPPRSPKSLNPTLSRSLEYLILKLLDKDPNKRYARASQVRRILASMLTPTKGDFPRQVRPALTGNEAALTRLLELWHETKRGRGQVVFIKGEAGVGKTRLAQELAHRLGKATLLVGQCQKLDESPAYHPFVEALHTYFACTAPEVALQQVGFVLGQMGQMLPEIRQIIPESVRDAIISPLSSSHSPNSLNADESNPLAAELESTPSLAGLIEQVALQRPWLIVLDDLHWADQNTLQLFCYLSYHCREMPLMMVGIYQENYIAENQFFGEMLDTLNKTVDDTTISMQPMNQAEIEQLLESLWLQEAPKNLATTIYRRSQGNPFFAEEIAKGLVDDDVVSWRDNKWHFASVIESSLPKDIQEATLRRINRLSKETQTLLHQAAVLGRTFRFTDLHEVSDLSEWDALESLDIALERQLLSEVVGEQVLRFKHVTIQNVFYQNLSQLKRQLMHRESGEALERRAKLDGPSRDMSAALAHHFYQAGEYRKTLTYSRQAAQRAEAVFAGQMALIWYTQALDTLDHLNQATSTDLERFDLLLAREHIYSYLGNTQAQAIELVALQTNAQLLDDPTRQVMVHNRQAAYDRAIGHFNEAKAEAQAALIVARQAGLSLLKGESILQMAQTLAVQGHLEEALEQANLAQKALTNQDQAWPGLGSLYNLLGVISFNFHQYNQAQIHFKQALTLNRAIGNWPGQALSLAWLGRVCLRLGLYSEAKLLGNRGLEMSRAIGYRLSEAMCLHNLGLLYQALALDSVAKTFIVQAISIWGHLQDRPGEAEALKILGSIYRSMDDYPAAQDTLAQTLKITQEINLIPLEAEIWFETGLTFEAQENLGEAATAYENSYRLQGGLADEAGKLEAAGGLARCYLAKNEIQAAKEIVDKGLDWLAAHDLGSITYPIQLYLTIYRVLRSTNNSEAAKKALEVCQSLIQQRADTIEEADLRSLFLKQITEDENFSSESAS